MKLKDSTIEEVYLNDPELGETFAELIGTETNLGYKLDTLITDYGQFIASDDNAGKQFPEMLKYLFQIRIDAQKLIPTIRKLQECLEHNSKTMQILRKKG